MWRHKPHLGSVLFGAGRAWPSIVVYLHISNCDKHTRHKRIDTQNALSKKDTHTKQVVPAHPPDGGRDWLVSVRERSDDPLQRQPSRC